MGNRAPVHRTIQNCSIYFSRWLPQKFSAVCRVEMFLLPGGAVVVNEVAPRPHNSGHYTMAACPTSQFEQHLRAVLGWPLGEGHQLPGSAIMLNLLVRPPSTD